MNGTGERTPPAHDAGRTGGSGLRRIGLGVRDAQYGRGGERGPRHRDAGSDLLRRPAHAGGEQRRRLPSDDRWRRAPHPAGADLLPARYGPPVDPSQIETQAHRTDARRRSRGDRAQERGPALPINRGTVGSIVVVGDLATTANLGDVGSSTVVPAVSVSPLAGIQAAAGGAAGHARSRPDVLGRRSEHDRRCGVVVVVAGSTPGRRRGQITIGDREGLVLPT